MLGHLLAIAMNTFKEAIRDRILYGFLFFAVSLIVFSWVLGQLSFNENLRAVIDVGLAGISLFAVLMSIFLGITLFHKEIEKKTLYTVLARPLSRPVYLTGKFLGLTATLAVLIALMMVVWVSVLASQGGGLTEGLLLALVFVFFENMLVIAMALFFTSFSSPILSGLFCLGLFIGGRNASLLGDLAARKSMAELAPLLEIIEAIIPNFYLFYPSGKMIEGAWASVHGQFVSSGYAVSALAYGACYTVVFLLLSMALFSRRDLI